MRALSRIVPVFGAFALVGVGFVLGQAQSEKLAAEPKGVVVASSSTPAAPATTTGDKRVIAYVYGNVPITREEFGDYLIQQHGRERVRLYVNRRIIEMAAAKRNIVVTPQEIDAIIDQDCGKLGMDKKQFIENVLKQKYGKTMWEWREDVIKPRLMMQAMCKDQLKIDDEELKKVYENLYGEKIQCQIILWPKGQDREVAIAYNKIRADKAAFDAEARGQVSSDLARNLGMVDPIGRYSGPGTAKIEEIAFSLKDGQLSEIISTPGGTMVIKRVGSVPSKMASVPFESVKTALIKELTDRLMEQEIPKMFAAINAEAKPMFVLAPLNETREEAEARSKALGVDPAKLEQKK